MDSDDGSAQRVPLSRRPEWFDVLRFPGRRPKSSHPTLQGRVSSKPGYFRAVTRPTSARLALFGSLEAIRWNADITL
ncbi:hypothetical protein SLA2020_262440 [Shorea laevis]